MQRRKSKTRNFRCNRTKDRRSITSICCWGVVLYFLYGCASTHVASKFNAPLCLSGEGTLKVIFSNESHRVKYESLSKPNLWLIGIQAPLIGEKIVRFGKSHGVYSKVDLSVLIGGIHKVEHGSMEEIFELISKFHEAASSDWRSLSDIRGDKFILYPRANRLSLNNGRYESYRLDLVHNGLLFNNLVSTLFFDFTQCDA